MRKIERNAGRHRETEGFYTERQTTGRETGNRLIGRQREKEIMEKHRRERDKTGRKTNERRGEAEINKV